MLFKRLLMAAVILYSAVSSVAVADEFSLTDTVYLDSQPLARSARLFKVKDRLVVVNEVDKGHEASITVYSEKGVLIEKETYNFNIAMAVLGPDQAVYLASEDGQFARYGLNDNVRWQKRIAAATDSLYCDIHVSDDIAYVSLPRTSQVMALAKADGALTWIKTFPVRGYAQNFSIAGGDINIVAYHGENKVGFHTLDAVTGEIKVANYYTSETESASRAQSFVRTKTSILGSVANRDWHFRVIRTDLNGNLKGEMPVSAICGSEVGVAFFNIAERVYASCYDIYSSAMTSIFVELDDEGNVLRTLGTVGTYMNGFYHTFGKKVIFRGGHYQQDYGVTKFVFSDGVNLSPMLSVLGGRSELPIQIFAFDDKSENSELAVLSYDRNKEQQYVILFDAK